MTTRLYYDSDTLTFDARVVDHDGDPTRVILDRTAFYPTSGGQPHDTGVLNDRRVIDVIDHDDRIVHVLDAPMDGEQVHGVIDAERRRDFTVQHTAQHLISALADHRFSWRTESVHFGTQHSTIEFDTTSASPEELEQLHQEVAGAIAAALPVTVGYEDAAAATALRKPAGRTGIIRIITIAGIDRSACGGTHVTSTGLLGSVVWTGVERIRGRVRLGYLAGSRVAKEFASRGAILASLATSTGGSIDELVELVPRRLEALREAEKRIGALERELAAYRIQELLRETPGGSGGVRRLVLHPGAATVEALRLQGHAATTMPNVVFIATSASPPTVIVAASPDAGVDAGAMLKSALASVGGRGGGSSSLAQGTVAGHAELDRVVELLTAS